MTVAQKEKKTAVRTGNDNARFGGGILSREVRTFGWGDRRELQKTVFTTII